MAGARGVSSAGFKDRVTQWGSLVAGALLLGLLLLTKAESACPCDGAAGVRPISRVITRDQANEQGRTSAYGIPPGFVSEGGDLDPSALLPLRIRHIQTGYLMALVPAGTYSIGGEVPGLGEADHPRSYVQLRPFWIGVNEVTRGQAGLRARSSDGDGERAQAGPWVGVTWHEAHRWALSRGMRLPSEAEWEVASRGTDGRRFPWGNEGTTASLGLTDVGQRPSEASPFGCLDMAGNAEEWCGDWYDPTYYSQLLRGAATSGPAFSPRSAKVVRGTAVTRSQGTMVRHYLRPEAASSTVGFRVAVTPITIQR